MPRLAPRSPRWFGRSLLGIATALLAPLAPLALLTAIATPVHAHPGVEGARNLGIGGAARASASGSSAYFINPAGMSMTKTLGIEANYQAAIERNTHGVATVATDSLSSPRVALGVGYVFMHGSPEVAFLDDQGERRALGMTQRAQEVGLALSLLVVPGWLAIGVRPKYHNASLRFRDRDGVRHDAQETLHAFGVDAGATLSIAGWVNLAVVGYNLSGPQEPAYTEDRDPELAPFTVAPGSFDPQRLPRVSTYPRGFGHGVAVFPLQSLRLSFNFDGAYDFTSYADQKFVRKTLAGGGEYFLGRLALRLGGGWDSRGPGDADDRGFLSAGIGVLKTPDSGTVGVAAYLSARRDLTGPLPETVLGATLGLLFNPGF